MSDNIITLPASKCHPIRGNRELRDLCLYLVRHVNGDRSQDADQREAEARAGAQIANAILAARSESIADLGYKLSAAIAVTVTHLDPDHAGCVLLGAVLDDLKALQEGGVA